MAWLAPYRYQCQTYGCNGYAIYELKDRRNISYGLLCKKCGPIRLKKLNAEEEKAERAQLRLPLA